MKKYFFCGTVLSSHKDISKFNQYMKSNTALESLIKKQITVKTTQKTLQLQK